MAPEGMGTHRGIWCVSEGFCSLRRSSANESFLSNRTETASCTPGSWAVFFRLLPEMGTSSGEYVSAGHIGVSASFTSRLIVHIKVTRLMPQRLPYFIN